MLDMCTYKHSFLCLRNLLCVCLQESAERHVQALNDRAGEMQDLRKELADTQLQLRNAQRLNATATQDGHLETAKLRAMLAEKDALINVRLGPVIF